MVNMEVYTGLVEGSLLDAIARGVTQFDQIITSLPGVYPSTALNSLRRLVSMGKIPSWVLANAVRHVRRRRARKSSAHHRIVLPIPHPLDYDWRFSELATQYLLRRCFELTHPGDTVALLGTPSLLRAAIERSCPRQWILLDAKPAVTNCFVDGTPEAQAFRCDVTNDPLPALKAALVVLDPPWYEEHMHAFLWAASQLCILGGHLLVSMPQTGTRPGIEQEGVRIMDWAQQLGLSLIQVEPGALPYITPPFERNALQAEGLYAIPEEWRRGDLAVFLHAHQANVSRPMPTHEDEWAEEVLLGMRMRIRPQHEEGFQDPSLISSVRGDVLPSVSRRDQRRRFADVWTSGNRIFACQGRNVFQQIVQAVAAGQSPDEAVAAYLKRSLSAEESRLSQHAAHQILRIASLEQEENAFFREGSQHAGLGHRPC